jgi:hypothetical protein
MARRTTSLYLGFGGSGSKTLAEFAELVAFHQEMGSRSESNFAFLLFDTFRDDLRKGEARIRAAFEKTGSSPIVKTFCISQDYPTFNTKAGPKLQNAFLADTGRRLDRFWWSRNAKGRRTPFTAVRFPHSPEIGAGQAPLISTFLTWHWLDAPSNSIRDMIRDTVNELKLRNTAAGHGQDLGLETTVIAGLAGGTGRGCWHLLSLIVSQILKDEGQTNHPIGLFYDASAFPEILSQRPEWKMKMTVNSLTGFSELVGFRRNELEEIDDCYHMSLPSLTRPSEEKADIINTVDLVGTDSAGNPVNTSGYGPVSRAFVVFGAGRAGSPGESSLYYQVGANVLYTRFIEQLQGQGANTNEFGSVGCASFVVPISKVVDYAKRAVSLVAASRLIGGTDSDETLSRVVDGFARRVNIGDFGGEVDGSAAHAIGRVSNRVRSSVDSEFDDIMKDADGKARDRLLELGKTYPNSDEAKQEIRRWVTDEIAKALWETVPDSIGQGGSLRAMAITAAQDINQSATPATASGKPALNPIALAVERIVTADTIAPDAKGPVDLRCYGMKKAVTARIKEWLEKEVKRVGNLAADSEQAPAGALKAYEKAVGGILNSSISPQERDDIRREIKEHYLAQTRDTMRDEIKAALTNAVSELGTLVDRIDTVITTITEQNREEERELAERARETFWGDEDFERIIASGAGDVAYSTSILAETEIKPVITVTRKALENKVDAAIQECDKSPRRDGRGLKGALDDVRRHASAILRRPASGTNNADGMNAALKKSISEIGKQIELGQDFYREHFSFTDVVRQHLVAWHHKWHELAHAPVTRAKIEREFQMLFGTKLPDAIRDEGFASNSGDIEKAVRAVCLQMAVQIGHRCDVLATQLAEDSYAIDRAAVVLPADAVFGEEFKKECEKEANSGDRLFKDNGFTVITTFDESGDTVGDPYSMLGYASEDFNLGSIDDDKPLERIKSLTRQYEGNPDVLAWLEACEDPEGSSVFVDGSSSLKEADKCFGLGYSFPFMVQEERMRRCRWRPWARQAEARRERDKEFVGDALLFALLEPAKSDSPPPEASLAWNMPLVSLPAIPHFNAAWALTRPAYRQTSGEQAPTPTHPSTPEGLSFPGILDVFKNFKDETKGYVNAIAGEAAIYFGRILPEADTKLTPDVVTKRLFDGLQERLKAFAADMSGGEEDMKERSRKELAKLILRCGELRGMTCAELADHFARRS